MYLSSALPSGISLTLRRQQLGPPTSAIECQRIRQSQYEQRDQMQLAITLDPRSSAFELRVTSSHLIHFVVGTQPSAGEQH